MARFEYLLNVLYKYAKQQATTCPHCGNNRTNAIGRKFVLLQLRKCQACNLLFRYPKDDSRTNAKFYSGVYKEPSTTDLPSEATLSEMISNRFENTDKNFKKKIELLKSYKATGSVLDYGASWGYATWQIQQAGFEASGFEIDADRAAFGTAKLGLKIYIDWSELMASHYTFDAIFTSHVLEHLPDLQTTFSDFNRLLKPDGILLIFVPNSSGVEDPVIFARKKSFAFGEKHTFAFTADFFEQVLPRHGFEVLQIDVQPHGEPKQNLIEGHDLLIAAVKRSVV